VGGNITADGVQVTMPASSCSSCDAPGCQASNNAACCDASCLGGCADDGVCNACAEGFLRATDGRCGKTCPAGQKEYGFKVHIVDEWRVGATFGQKRWGCDFDDSGRHPAGTEGGGWARVDARRYGIVHLRTCGGSGSTRAAKWATRACAAPWWLKRPSRRLACWTLQHLSVWCKCGVLRMVKTLAVSAAATPAAACW
jgi:hypothetical protein